MRAGCIFCSQPLDGSDEHIIPDSINGKLHSKAIICSLCNNYLGRYLDPIIKETLFTTMHVLGFEKASTLKFEDEHGTTFIMDNSTGKLKSEKIITGDIEVDGKPGIQVHGQNDEQVARAFAKKLVRKFGINKAFQVAKSMKVKTTKSNLVPSELSTKSTLIVSPKLLIALEKIIYEFCAFSNLDPTHFADRCLKVRNLDVDNTDLLIVNNDQSMRKPELTEISHLIVIRSEDNKLYAYVELFNVICGLIVLDTNYTGQSINHVYYQDALTGERLENEVKINFNQIKIDDQYSFETLQNDMFERKANREIIEHVTQLARDTNDELDAKLAEGTISIEEHRDILANTIATEIAHLSIEFPFLFEFEEDENHKHHRPKINYINSLINEEFKCDFEEYYGKLIGVQINVVEETKQYYITSFHYTKERKHENKTYLKAYFHLRSIENDIEKHIVAKDLFDGLGIPPPPDGSYWLD